MAKLSPRVEWLLQDCALAMCQGRSDNSIDLSSLNSIFQEVMDDIRAFLAREVESLTRNRLTVVPADPALFRPGSGLTLFLAVCPTPKPEGRIEEITAGVTLYQIGPYSNGFNKDPGASPEEVAKYRENQLRAAAARVASALAADAKKMFVKGLEAIYFAAAKSAVDNTSDLARRDQASVYLREGSDGFTVEKLASVSEALGLELSEFIPFIQRALRR